MRFQPTALLLALLPFSSAFYPYLPTEATTSHTVESRSLDTTATDLRVYIRKLALKRDNGFHISTAASPSQVNSLGVGEDGSDVSYFATIKFGTGTKEYYMLLDSAASDTWVMSSDCATSACGVHTLLGTSVSSTLKEDQTQFAVTYGTGSVSGIQGTDTVHLGNMSVPLTFGLAQNVSNEFSTFVMDGILGLGRPENIADRTGIINAPALMDVLVSQKVISSKLFGLDLWRAADGGSNNGEITFGSTDASRYSGGLTYVTAITNTNGFWEIPVDEASVNGKIAGLPGRTAIIDSGTSYILMPHDDAVQLHELIPNYAQDGAEMFTVPCNSTASPQFTFAGATFGIDPRDYVGRAATQAGRCSSNIVGRQTFGPKQWLVGDVFLKNVYSVFDFDGQRVGFAIKNNAESAAGAEGTGTSTFASGATSTPSGTSSGSPSNTGSDSASTSKASSSASMRYGKSSNVRNWSIFALRVLLYSAWTVFI